MSVIIPASLIKTIFPQGRKGVIIRHNTVPAWPEVEVPKQWYGIDSISRYMHPRYRALGPNPTRVQLDKANKAVLDEIYCDLWADPNFQQLAKAKQAKWYLDFRDRIQKEPKWTKKTNPIVNDTDFCDDEWWRYDAELKYQAIQKYVEVMEPEVEAHSEASTVDAESEIAARSALDASSEVGASSGIDARSEDITGSEIVAGSEDDTWSQVEAESDVDAGSEVNAKPKVKTPPKSDARISSIFNNRQQNFASDVALSRMVEKAQEAQKKRKDQVTVLQAKFAVLKEKIKKDHAERRKNGERGFQDSEDVLKWRSEIRFIEQKIRVTELAHCIKCEPEEKEILEVLE